MDGENKETPGVPAGNEAGPQSELKDILNLCMDAPGYVIFVGILRSDGDVMMLDFKYRRFHLNIEDAKIASNNFAKQIHDDLDNIK